MNLLIFWKIRYFNLVNIYSSIYYSIQPIRLEKTSSDKYTNHIVRQYSQNI